MKKVPIVIISLLVIVIFISVFINITPIKKSEPVDIVEFEGLLEQFDNRCAVDLPCKAVVNGYTIVTNPGDEEVPALGKSDIKSDDIGKKVSVRARRVNNGNLTLVGDFSLYVKLAE